MDVVTDLPPDQHLPSRRNCLVALMGMLAGASCRPTPTSPNPTPTPKPGSPALPTVGAQSSLIEGITGVTRAAQSAAPRSLLIRAEGYVGFNGRIGLKDAWNFFFAYQDGANYPWDRWTVFGDGTVEYKKNESQIGSIEFNDLSDAIKTDSPGLITTALGLGLQHCVDIGRAPWSTSMVIRYRFGSPVAEISLCDKDGVSQGDLWLNPADARPMFSNIKCQSL